MKQRPTFFEVHRSRLLGCLLGAGALAAQLSTAADAGAQADERPPQPNILLLVDTSGSMDYKTGVNEFPACRYSETSENSSVTSERSRWIDLVEVLTGSIADYQCQRLNRNGTEFRTEYELAGQAPYDALYPNPYHRPVSAGCVAGPGTWDPVSPAAYSPTGSILFHKVQNRTDSCADFPQLPDGVLDSFSKDVRFGLMTFDSEPRRDKDVDGLWSYYLGTNPVQGKPENCPDLQDQEVGSRNPNAPAWEGRAVGFGNPVADTLTLESRNAMIQKILLATRPYGATPIAGMLEDAFDYFEEDESDDPVDPSFKFGPKDDPATCRRKAVILLTDGQPNLDLRPACETGTTGACPYEKPEDIAARLKAAGIEVFVIGFGLSTFDVNGTPTTCASIDASSATGPCADESNDDPNLQACCALNRIAAAGGHAKVNELDTDWLVAHFADDRSTLRGKLSSAIGANFPPTSRTAPVQASGSTYMLKGADVDFARGFRFAAGFQPGTAGQGWVGRLTRSRYKCETVNNEKVPVLQAPVESEGDDFVANVNKSGPDARTLYTVLSTSELNDTLRPNLAPADNEGVGTQTATQGTYTTAASFVAAITPEHMQLQPTDCTEAGVTPTPDACRDRVLNWTVGLSNGTVHHRCPDLADGACSLVGDFMRSAPHPVSGRPSALISDASYDAFVAFQETAKRPSVLYASSNDGFLHAFKMGPVSKPTETETMRARSLETNELWAFVPPGVVPNLYSAYPGAHVLLLDGSPAVKDVVAREETAALGYKFKLERTKADALAGTGTWRTILVQGYGSERPGYFAIDITDPVPSTTGGPKFLWQLVDDEDGNRLFGKGSATPLITTVFAEGKEIAVAVLPGGSVKEPSTGTCTRDTDLTGYSSSYMPRASVRCYETDEGYGARSLTIVRLDSGEVLRTFRPDETKLPKLLASQRITTVPIDSPLTGQPVAFPADVGAVADRIFIGDQDGTLWRVSLAGEPDDWKMELFFDTFPSNTPFSHGATDGQPIVTPPIISVDQIGNLTIAVSTGDQEALASSPSTANYVWSLTEKPNSTRTQFEAVPNWHLDFKGDDAGYRVIGNMALFAGTLYFAAMNRPDDGSGACSQGVGRVYGMHYLTPEESATAGKGGVVDETFVGEDSEVNYIPAEDITGGGGEAFLSGVAIGQQPTCESGGTDEENEYFAFGVHHSLGGARVGKFQLFISTGSTVPQPTRTDITAVDQGGVNAAALDLTDPRVITRVDSWAAIVE